MWVNTAAATGTAAGERSVTDTHVLHSFTLSSLRCPRSISMLHPTCKNSVKYETTLSRPFRRVVDIYAVSLRPAGHSLNVQSVHFLRASKVGRARHSQHSLIVCQCCDTSGAIVFICRCAALKRDCLDSLERRLIRSTECIQPPQHLHVPARSVHAPGCPTTDMCLIRTVSSFSFPFVVALRCTAGLCR